MESREKIPMLESILNKLEEHARLLGTVQLTEGVFWCQLSSIKSLCSVLKVSKFTQQERKFAADRMKAISGLFPSGDLGELRDALAQGQ